MKYTVEVTKEYTKWFKEGTNVRHRTDGPAIEYANGIKFWYLNGQRHRTDGPAIEWADGAKEWYLNGQRHRTDGPAIEYADGSKYWWFNGQLHRTDGPAVDCADGTKEWHLNGKNYSEKNFLKKVKELSSPSCDGKIVEIEGKKYKLTEV